MFHAKLVRKIKTQSSCSIAFFRKLCRLWDNVEKYFRFGQHKTTIWRMRIACWITKATNTHSQYVILIDFPLQQWLRERTSMLRFCRVVLNTRRWTMSRRSDSYAACLERPIRVFTSCAADVGRTAYRHRQGVLSSAINIKCLQPR
jgi:hypothetical protein